MRCLEAQQASVRAFVAAQGWTLVAEFSDVASGKDDRRAGFQAALLKCRQLGAVLVAARHQRLRAHIAEHRPSLPIRPAHRLNPPLPPSTANQTESVLKSRISAACQKFVAHSLHVGYVRI